MIPGDIAVDVERAAAKAAGADVRIRGATRVGGGCISPAARVDFDGGAPAFLKWAEPGGAPADFFTCEAESLAALATPAAVRVPRVEAVAERWLLLEWIEPGRPTAAGWSRLGDGLARLHRTPPGNAAERRAERYGWPRDNYIGSLPQANVASADWAAFWRDRRLTPQLERAYGDGHFNGPDRAAFDALLDRLDDVIGGPARVDGPSLLHGDLWNGNVHFAAAGDPALIDPSTYVGHREVDLAMAELFGGFDAGFFDAYREAWPLEPGYATGRRHAYQLYYLLVHVNLFGGSYVAGARSARDRALRA